MSEMLFTSILQSPYVFLAVAAVLFAAISLVFAQLSHRGLKRATETLTRRLEKEIAFKLQPEEVARTVKADLEHRLCEATLKASQNSNALEQQAKTLRSTLADLDRRLCQVNSKASQNAEEAEQFRRALSGVMDRVNSITSMFLVETKDLLLQSLAKIENLEANLNVAPVEGKQPSRKEATLRFHSGDGPLESPRSFVSPVPCPDPLREASKPLNLMSKARIA